MYVIPLEFPTLELLLLRCFCGHEGKGRCCQLPPLIPSAHSYQAPLALLHLSQHFWGLVRQKLAPSHPLMGLVAGAACRVMHKCWDHSSVLSQPLLHGAHLLPKHFYRSLGALESPQAPGCINLYSPSWASSCNWDLH